MHYLVQVLQYLLLPLVKQVIFYLKKEFVLLVQEQMQTYLLVKQQLNQLLVN